MRHTGTVQVTTPDDSPRRPALRLRTRVTLYFAVTALATSLGLAVATYGVARSYLIDQRLQVARTQAYSNARTVRDQLLAEQRTDPARDQIGRAHV